MNWFYARDGQSVGPLQDAEFERLAAMGTIAPDTLVWREGMAAWQPRSSVAPASAVGLAASGGTVICPDCGGTFPAAEVVTIAGVTVCARCKPTRLQMLEEGQVTMPGGLWRKGKMLVMAREAQLPDRCVHCNTTADLRRVKRSLYWHHPAVYVTLLVGLLVYVILALVLRKTAKIEVSICRAHAARRRWRIAISWILLLAVPASIGLLVANRIENALWIVPPLLLIAAIAVSMLSRIVYARKIDEKNVWVGGICPAYIADLPEWSGK